MVAARPSTWRWAGLALGIGVTAACGFPNVTFDSENADGGGASDEEPADATGAESTDTPGDPSVGANAIPPTSSQSSTSFLATSGTSTISVTTSGTSTISVTVTTAATTTSRGSSSASSTANGHGAGSSSAACEDADNDGYPAASCGGTDCNDNDARAHPGVTAWVDATPTAAPGWILGDWNCDGSVQFEYEGSVDCKAVNASRMDGGSCDSTEGFAGAQPDCGVSDDAFVQCKAGPASLLCASGKTRKMTQGCL
jgi:hypothetical protein